VSDAPFSGIAEGDVLIPADPVSLHTSNHHPLHSSLLKSPTDREALLIHAEILAMQARWGISYKDAAHRLYLVEVEKFRVAKHAENAITSLRDRIENCITHDISPVIKYIDSPAFHLPTPRDLEEKFRRYQS
jgi:hypothetical protein